MSLRPGAVNIAASMAAIKAGMQQIESARFAERLEDVLVRRKIASYRSVRNLLRRHELTVNGVRALSKALPVRAGQDVIALDGRALEIPPDIYLMMNKPPGYECSHGKCRYASVFSLLPPELLRPEYLGVLHTVGRLDVDTAGLLVLTTNGTFSRSLALPDSHVEKTYRVLLERPVAAGEQDAYRAACAAGVHIAAERGAPAVDTRPSRLEWCAPACCTLTVTEGKYHEVKRIFAALDNTVLRLERLSLGGLALDAALPPGAWRPLRDDELCLLSRPPSCASRTEGAFDGILQEA